MDNVIREKKGVYLIQSSSNKNIIYRIDIINGIHDPECPSFKFRRSCKHLTLAMEEYKKEISITNDIIEKMKEYNGDTVSQFYEHFSDEQIEEAINLGNLKIINGLCYII